jgi:protein-L-isoaspartate O-methyltransferase
MLEWTGERFLPWIRESTIAYEHLHRYALVAMLVQGQRVLDLACGEGYGVRMLAGRAASVVGVDIDENVVRHASAKYGAPNIEFHSGSITATPIKEDHSFDTVVCFEAIEHIDDHERLLLEVKRLLKPGGVFIVSTPNKAVYQDVSSEENPYHVKELYFEEFQSLLAAHFRNTRFLGQRIHPSSSIWPIGTASPNGLDEFVMKRGESEFQFIHSNDRIPLYFIAVASDAEAFPQPVGSVLLDESDSLLQELDDTIQHGLKQVREREETIRSLEGAVEWRAGQVGELTEGLEWTQKLVAELEKKAASDQEALAWRARQVSELEKARDFWESESSSLNAQLQETQRRLTVASETLAGIYASRGWKLILRLRGIREAIRGLVRRSD